MTYLLKLGELTLKGGNRGEFEKVLKRNLRALLKGATAKISVTNGRYFVDVPEEHAEQAERAFFRLFGITGWALTQVSDKTVDAVIDACIEEAHILERKNIKTFKIEARRADKSFPLDSYGIMASAGRAVLENVPALKVNIKMPEAVISVEIREKAYVYSNSVKGLRGLPVGTAGRGLLLLSGGIDSPVAGFLMAGRGMGIDAVHFHAYPFTSDEARQKVAKLAEILGGYTMGVRLHIIRFTDIQTRIKECAPFPWTTVLLRMAMMKAAENTARRCGAKCIITGESLSQVASQTVENIACTQSLISMTVFRPLIGMDKESIVRIAEKIGTYKTSILPYEDCCMLFSPEHPILRGDVKEALTLFEKLDIDGLIKRSIEERVMYRL
ncbi:MAG: tRNA 4-thiouridine(8) synthase ThiI [Treponema sp.]|jgi:thiamine biosynthesis protein ThiI|nr:tRNA 4-thiouridine(8) synthase ThiI [Treponema sp.]